MNRWQLALVAVVLITCRVLSLGASQRTDLGNPGLVELSGNGQPDPLVCQAVASYQAQRLQRRNTMGNDEEHHLPVILAQLQVIRTFLAGQREQGIGHTAGYWTQTFSAFCGQGRRVVRNLRWILSGSGGKVHPLLEKAVTRVADTLEAAVTRKIGLESDPDYWIDQARLAQDHLVQAATEVKAILDAVNPPQPQDIASLARGQLPIIADLLLTQTNHQTEGDICDWIHDRNLLAIQGRVIAGILRELPARLPGVSELLRVAVGNIAADLGNAFQKDPPGRSAADCQQAAQTMLKALQDAGKQVRHIARAI